MSVAIRRAGPADLDFIAGLVVHEEVQPYLAAARPSDRESVRADIELTAQEPESFGLFVIEVDGQRAGTMRFVRSNALHRIADLGGLAVHPDFRGRRVADEAARLFVQHLFDDLGFHRLQLEIYGFNDRAIEHAERSGFVLEGRRRNAYFRHGSWADGVLFGITEEDRDARAQRPRSTRPEDR